MHSTHSLSFPTVWIGLIGSTGQIGLKSKRSKPLCVKCLSDSWESFIRTFYFYLISYKYFSNQDCPTAAAGKTGRKTFWQRLLGRKGEKRKDWKDGTEFCIDYAVVAGGKFIECNASSKRKIFRIRLTWWPTFFLVKWNTLKYTFKLKCIGLHFSHSQSHCSKSKS